MASLASDAPLSDRDAREAFHREGSCVLRGLLTQAGIDLLHSALSDVGPPKDARAGLFSRHDYVPSHTVPALRELGQDPLFGQVLSSFTGRSLYLTEGLSFGVKPGHRGYPWHFDSNTFNFIRPEDFGVSLWIPLCPIRNDEQGGGLAVAPQSKISAHDRYRFIASLLELGDHEATLAALRRTYPTAPNPYLGCGELEERVLNANAMIPDLELGDAILFRKDTWHCSVELKEGPLKERQTYTLRFIDADARYNPAFVEAQTQAWLNMGLDVQKVTAFGRSLSDLPAGAPVIQSKNFQGIPLSHS